MGFSQEEKAEKACVDCHFFAVVPKTLSPEEEHTASLEERRKTLESGFGWTHDVAHLKCYKGVWEDELKKDPEYMSDKDRWDEYARRDRSGECFFFEHREGMNLEAAEELQRREADRERFWERNRWVRWGALAAIAAVVLDAISRLVRFLIRLSG